MYTFHIPLHLSLATWLMRMSYTREEVKIRQNLKQLKLATSSYWGAESPIEIAMGVGKSRVLAGIVNSAKLWL
jgi:hypothetical protein